jgi:hypothetical protein
VQDKSGRQWPSLLLQFACAAFVLLVDFLAGSSLAGLAGIAGRKFLPP